MSGKLVVKRCKKCVNKCELTNPKCETGRLLAEKLKSEDGLYEEEIKVSKFKLWWDNTFYRQ